MRSPPTCSRRSNAWRCGRGWRPPCCNAIPTSRDSVNGDPCTVNGHHVCITAVTVHRSPFTVHQLLVSDLQSLYQSIILDHNRRPKNYGALEGATSRAEGRNPLCGDEVAVELKLDGDTITDVRFTAVGCAVSRAAASIMNRP